MALTCLHSKLQGGYSPGHVWEGQGSMNSLYGKDAGLGSFRLCW